MAPRLLHTMLRVGNVERSLSFYVGVLGMKVLRTTDRPEQKYSLTFVGYGGEDSNTVLELTYNYGIEKYEQGSGFGHIAIGVDDIHLTCEALSSAGFTISRQPGPVQGGTTVIAFAVDPDGYKVELIQGRDTD